MTRIRGFVAVALIAVLMLSIGCRSDKEKPPNEVQLNDADNGTTITVARDGEVAVALPSNPSTGYSWAVVPPEPTNLELIGEPRFVPAGSTTPVVGAGGTEVFTFKATSKAGTSTLTLAYNRPFTPTAPPEKTFKVTVEVR